MEHQAQRRRINPRRLYVIAASGLKRIILGNEVGSRDLSTAHQAAIGKSVRSTHSARRHHLVLVHSERGALDEHARQVIAAAAMLADAETGVVVAVLGGTAENLASYGADIVIHLPSVEATHFLPELGLALAQALVAQYQPLHIFMPDRHADADLGRRLAARTRCTIATDVVELNAHTACRRMPGKQFARCALPEMVLLARDAADAVLPFVGRGDVVAAPVLAALPVESVRDLGTETSRPDQIALEEADFILSGGNGMRDMDTFTALAKVLGAATGASRVAVDDGRFVRAKQIGATGKTVQASVYVALGISGAAQHLQGIKDCAHVIAVNRDENAPITKRANLTLVEDVQALMLALLKLVQHAHQA
jgi:electron transfer flavoprotein alpha subunit